MGGEPYWYIVPYEADLDAALQKLRCREFEAGRYYPAVPLPKFPVTAESHSPGAQHASIEEAFAAAETEGTRSILDLSCVGKDRDYGVAEILSESKLKETFGTAQPSRQAVENAEGFWDEIERGQGVCIVLFKDGRPDEIYFAGYSYD